MKPRIRIKYCGGCNPDYDRGQLVEKIKKRLGDSVTWVPSNAKTYDLVLAIQGCETACADLTDFEGHEIHSVACLADADEFLRHIN